MGGGGVTIYIYIYTSNNGAPSNKQKSLSVLTKRNIGGCWSILILYTTNNGGTLKEAHKPIYFYHLPRLRLNGLLQPKLAELFEVFGAQHLAGWGRARRRIGCAGDIVLGVPSISILNPGILKRRIPAKNGNTNEKNGHGNGRDPNLFRKPSNPPGETDPVIEVLEKNDGFSKNLIGINP